MKVVEMPQGKFKIKDVSTNELEALYEALIYFEANRLPNADEFKAEKDLCLAMASTIDSQLILSKS